MIEAMSPEEFTEMLYDLLFIPDIADTEFYISSMADTIRSYLRKKNKLSVTEEVEISISGNSAFIQEHTITANIFELTTDVRKELTWFTFPHAVRTEALEELARLIYEIGEDKKTFWFEYNRRYGYFALGDFFAQGEDAENILRDAGVKPLDSDVEVAEKVYRLLVSAGVKIEDRFVWEFDTYPTAIVIVGD